MFSIKVFILIFSLTECILSAPNENKPAIIVIGAGPAGVAASSKLYSEGFNVKVLEAEDRIGGRVKSVEFGDAFVDLGAEWCHGEGGNVVYEMVKDLNLLGNSEFQLIFWHSNGSNLNHDLVLKIGRESVTKPSASSKEFLDRSVGQYIISSVNKYLKENNLDPNSQEYEFIIEFMEATERNALAQNGAFSWFEPAAIQDYLTSPGNNDLHWNGKGYKTIIDIMMKKFPKKDDSFKLEDQIMLNKEVSNIAIKGNNVEITCSDDSKFNADHVIFTPSLGVLKHDYETLFTPPVNEIKVSAIEDLGFGAVTKVMMHFAEPFWPETEGFIFIWGLEDKALLPGQFLKGPTLGGRSWLTNLLGFYTLKKNPNAISVWFTGELVPEIETMDEDILIEGVLFAFEKFLGSNTKLTKPDKVLRNGWFTNPHFRGTYSYQTVTSRRLASDPTSSNQILSEPIDDERGVPRILFAGEATHPTRFSTVHGAIETGHREADRIINMYKQ